MSREEELETEINKLQKELKDIRSKKKWGCTNCYKRTFLKRLTLKIYNPYDEGYVYPDFFIVCPICAVDTRIHRYKISNSPSKLVKWEFVDTHMECFLDIIQIDSRPEKYVTE